MWMVLKASFRFFQAVGAITGVGCQARAPGGSWHRHCELKSGAGGGETSWGLTRLWADNSSEAGGVRFGYRICIERHIGYLGHRVGEWKGPKESQMTGFLIQGPRRKAGLLT